MIQRLTQTTATGERDPNLIITKDNFGIYLMKDAGPFSEEKKFRTLYRKRYKTTKMLFSRDLLATATMITWAFLCYEKGFGWGSVVN
jgi:hypothetical protein